MSLLMRQANVAITWDFRDRLQERYPRVFEEPRFARLLQEMLFPVWRDDLTRHAVLSREVLAQLEYPDQPLRDAYVAQRFLDDFLEHSGVNAEFTEANWLAGRARTGVVKMPIDLDVAMTIEMEKEISQAYSLVDFVTGRKVPKKQGDVYARASRDARQAYEPEPGPNASWIRLLNCTPPHVFRQFEAYLSQAQDVALTIQRAERQGANLRTLHVLRLLGLVPTYQSVARTPRIYTYGQSMAHLSSNVRAVLLTGCEHLDLAAAQLAIIGKLWTLPTVNELLAQSLEDGTSVWQPLLDLVGLEAKDKGMFKRLVYSTAFGMSRTRLRREAPEWFGAERVERVFASPLVQELLDGRDRRAMRLRSEGGIVDAFGGRHLLAERRVARNKSPVSSLLAHEAQSYELQLMAPALDLTGREAEFRMVLWLHDGCYVRITQPERVERYVGRVQAAVDRRARQLGFATKLERETLM